MFSCRTKLRRGLLNGKSEEKRIVKKISKLRSQKRQIVHLQLLIGAQKLVIKLLLIIRQA